MTDIGGLLIVDAAGTRTTHHGLTPQAAHYEVQHYSGAQITEIAHPTCRPTNCRWCRESGASGMSPAPDSPPAAPEPRQDT